MPRTVALLALAMLPAALHAAAPFTPRTDLYGDPLPAGAVARLGTLRWRHPWHVYLVSYSPDGRLVVTVGGEESVRVWQATTGKELVRIPVSASNVVCSPDGKLIATTHYAPDKAIRLWDIATGKELRALRADELVRHPWALTFSRDGKALAALYTDNRKRPPPPKALPARIRIWQVAAGKEAAAFDAPDGDALTIAIAPDGKTLVVGQSRGICLCAAATGRKLRTLRRHKASRVFLAFAADGTLASASSEEAVVRLWDTATGRQKNVLRPREDVTSLAFSHDGKRLVSGGRRPRRSFRVWDVASGTTILTHQRPFRRGMGQLVLSPNGKTVAEGNFQAPSFWDVATGKEVLHQHGHARSVTVIAFAPGGKALTSAGGSVRVWERATGRQVALLEFDDETWGVSFSPDGSTAITARWDGTIRIWDVNTGKEKRPSRIRVRSAGSAAGHGLGPPLAPDGKTLAVAGALWDRSTGKRLWTIEASENGPYTFSPDGRTLASVGRGVLLWDVRTGRALPGLSAESAEPSSYGVPCFSPDGSLLAVPDSSKGFLVWELPTRRFVGGFEGKGGGIWKLAFSPDGRLLACGQDDGSVELWEVLTWTVLGRRQGWKAVGRGLLRHGISSLAFSPDGKLLATGQADTTVLLWDVPALWAPPHPTGPLTATQLDALWVRLGSDQAEDAFKAVGALTQAPRHALPLLSRQLRPAPPFAKNLAKWLTDLESDDFAVREKATEQIGRLGRPAAPILRKALDGRLSAEARRRVKQALTKTEQAKRTPEELRQLRAVLVLEQTGSAEARALLRGLAAGADGVPLTREAKAALRRLE